MFGKEKRPALRLQSAMEYLMTYGWAILIIAVVLGALFSLGVFGNLLGNHCVTTPGWSCVSATLATNGILTMDIGQATGSTITPIDAACSSTANSAGYPTFGPTGANTIENATAPTTNVAFSPSASIADGDTFTLTVPCYTSASTPAFTLGQAFTGSVWISYTISGSTSPIIAQITTSLTEKAS